jgi:hypothetical protein
VIDPDKTELQALPQWSRFRSIIVLFILVVFCGFLGYQAELILPTRPPKIENTYTPLTQLPPSEVGNYDVLGKVVDKTDAAGLLQTEAGRVELSADRGAVEITDRLIRLSRDAFYRETFGNEVLFTNVVGILDGPLNIGKAVLALKGQPTTNLQIPLNEDVTVGDRTFKAGSQFTKTNDRCQSS